MQVLVAYNPAAGDNGCEELRETVVALEGAGHEVATQSVKEERWQRILERPFDLVVVAGGDGTVAKVLKQLAGVGVPVSIVPTGSANNIARSLEGWEGPRFDIARLAWDGGTTLFVESCGGGVFAEMVTRAEDSRADEDKVELGLRTLLDVATDASPRRWQLDVDGRDVSGDYIAVELMNVAMLGPNVPLAPGANPGDGLLDVVLVRGGDAQPLSRHARSRLDSGPESELCFERHRARRVVFEPPPRSPIRADDEVLDELGGKALVATVESAVDLRRPHSPGRFS